MQAKNFSHWVIIESEVTKSTNDDALNFVMPENECRNFVFSAKKQTGGRGRFGRKWSDGEGNLMFSAIVKCDAKNSGLLSLVCGISVLQTIKFFAENADVKLKWPNDVLLEDKKVCGILIERKDENYVVVGIGVNIKNSPVLQNAGYMATSLKECKINVSKDVFLPQFLNIFDEWLAKIAKKEFNAVQEAWISSAKGINEEIEIKNMEEKITGKLVGVDENGAVVIEKNGEKISVFAGDVSYL